MSKPTSGDDEGEDNPFHWKHFVFEEAPAGEAHRQRVRFTPDSSKASPLPFSPTSTDNSLRSTGPARRKSRVVKSAVDQRAGIPCLPGTKIILTLLIACLCILALRLRTRVPMYSQIFSSIAANILSLSKALPKFSLRHPPREEAVPPQISQYVNSVVLEALRSQWSPRDYALSSEGSRIISALTSGDGSSSPTSPHPATAILRDNSSGGRCWTFSDLPGQVAIRLPFNIRPSYITIDHAPSNVATDIHQAPRRIRVWVALDGEENQVRYDRLSEQISQHGYPPLSTPSTMSDYVFVPLLDLEYDIHSAQNIQQFPVYGHIVEAELDAGVYVFQILENWGGGSTCIYRIRIHGAELSAIGNNILR